MLYRTWYGETSPILEAADELASDSNEVLKNQILPSLESLTLDEQKDLLERIFSVHYSKKE
jgi:hypothetical protein